MAILRSLLLRHRTTAASLLRCRYLSVAATPASFHFVSPQKPPTSPSPPWKRNPAPLFSSASPAAERPGSEEMRPCDPDISEIDGCDFNHWLIVVDFPKDPRPSPEEMVRFYEETCAKALNLSLEEAKKKMYAISTSNYTGFHVQVTEIESEKFQGQPGVVFVLPDSYADKENQEYGGDKYINGIIIPRPRNAKGKRIWDEPKQDQRRGPTPDHPGSQELNQQQRVYPPYTHQGLTQGPQSHPPPPPQPQQNYWVPPLGQGSDLRNHPSQQNYWVPPPPGQGSDPRNHPSQQNYWVPPPAGHGQRRPHQPSYPFQQNFGPAMVSPSPGRNPHQQGYFVWVPQQSNYNQGWLGNYAPPPHPSPPPQVVLVVLPHGGYQGQVNPVSYWPGPPSSGTVFGPGYPGPTQGPGFSQVDQRNYVAPDWYRAAYEQQGLRWHQANWQGYPGQPVQGQGYQGHPVQGYPGQPSEYQNNNGTQQGTPVGQQPENGHQGQGPPAGQWRGPSNS